MKCMNIQEVQSLVGTVNVNPILGYPPERLLCVGVNCESQKPCVNYKLVLHVRIIESAYIRYLKPNKHWLIKYFKPRVIKQVPVYESKIWDLPFAFANIHVNLDKGTIDIEFKEVVIGDD